MVIIDEQKKLVTKIDEWQGMRKKRTAHDSLLVSIALSDKKRGHTGKIELGFINLVRSDNEEKFTFYFDKSLQRKFMIGLLRSKEVNNVIEKVNEIIKNERNVEAPKVTLNTRP